MSGIATAIVGGAVIGAYASKEMSKSSSEASALQSAAQGNATAMQLQFLRENRADIADAVEKGLMDLETGFNAAIRELMPLASMEELNQAKELLSNPEAIMDRPSTRFQYKQGIEALQAAFSKTGGGGLSGRGMVAATEYGQNFASMNLDAELARLQPLIDIGIGARKDIANFSANEGIAKANLRVSGATGSGNITAGMMPSITQGITNQGNIAATNMINQANINTQLMSNISQAGTNLALYKANPQLFKGTG